MGCGMQRQLVDEAEKLEASRLKGRLVSAGSVVLQPPRALPGGGTLSPASCCLVLPLVLVLDGIAHGWLRVWLRRGEASCVGIHAISNRKCLHPSRSLSASA